ADIFSNLLDILKQFHHVIRTIPADGNILIHSEGDNMASLMDMSSWSHVHKIGTQETIAIDVKKNIFSFGEEIFDLNALPFNGMHNYHNALMAMYAASLHGVAPRDSFKALESFTGVKRRFETIYQDQDFIVIDDFAHHPTAISSTTATAKGLFDQKILGIIELGSNTMSGGFHGTELYKSAESLDKTLWLNLSGTSNDPHELTSLDMLLKELKNHLDEFGVILIMSNKDSKKISDPLIELIKAK
ncbi:MAG: glutamate ligase domain-containing protein, partial [Gammaproteobacteria bacterium]